MNKSVGIICEYNPFHNGHIYHLNKVKELFKDYTIILVLNGYFTERGELSIMTKEEKTNIALEYGIDLIVELPFVFGTQSSDLFASGAIQILNKLKVDSILFGSELDDINTLKKLVDIQNTNDYNNLVKEYLESGINYPTAMSKALKKLSNIEITTPNDLLGLSYIKAINEFNNTIKSYSIKRTNNYHSLNINSNIISASSIRNLLKNNEDISNYVPNSIAKLNLKYIDLNSYFDLIKYKIINEKNNLNIYQTVDEGIEYRLLKYINECNNVYELIEKVKTKRYTYNKIQRMLVHILCSFTKEEAKKCKAIEYIRILGFNDKGRLYLNKIKKNIDIPIISKLSNQYFKELDIENRVTNIYNIKQSNKVNEYKSFPIYK